VEFFDNGKVGQSGDDWFRLDYRGTRVRLLTAQLRMPNPAVAHRIRCYRLERAGVQRDATVPGTLPIVEYRDGRRRLEGLIRSDEWLTEPGGAEFPEARTGHRASRGYVPSSGSVAAERLARPEVRVSGERPC